MSILSFIIKKLSCKSSCSYNNTEFDNSHLHRNLNNYTLKHKDIETILKILHKRKIKDLSYTI